MARRGENIYKRKDGRWEGRIPNGYNEKGKKKYHSVYAHSYLGVKAKMREDSIEKQAKSLEAVISIEKAFYLWLESGKNNWKPSTYSCYVRLSTKQIIPCIRQIPIQEFDSFQINQFIEIKRKEHLSESYIRDMTNIILRVLRYMKEVYEYSIVIPSGVSKSSNYCEEKKLPSRNIMTTLERYLIAKIENSTCLGILLCCHTGLRIGEICALQWRDIDIERGVVHIRKTMQRITIYDQKTSASKIMITVPKTKQSLRDIPVSTHIMELIRQNRRDNEEYIIQGSRMDYAEPRTVQYRFKSILKQCGIEPFNFHMLRHAFATRCITLGFDINTVSELLGHSGVQVTLNRYVHSSEERKRYLMEHFQL